MVLQKKKKKKEDITEDIKLDRLTFSVCCSTLTFYEFNFIKS